MPHPSKALERKTRLCRGLKCIGARIFGSCESRKEVSYPARNMKLLGLAPAQKELDSEWPGREDLNLRPPGPEPDFKGF